MTQTMPPKGPQDISQAKNPDMRASWTVMQRAAALAPQTALQTNSAIVIVEKGKRITTEQLRELSESTQG